MTEPKRVLRDHMSYVHNKLIGDIMKEIPHSQHPIAVSARDKMIEIINATFMREIDQGISIFGIGYHREDGEIVIRYKGDLRDTGIGATAIAELLIDYDEKARS